MLLVDFDTILLHHRLLENIIIQFSATIITNVNSVQYHFDCDYITYSF